MWKNGFAIWLFPWASIYTQQIKLYYLNIVIILSGAMFNISSASYWNILQDNTTFRL